MGSKLLQLYRFFTGEYTLSYRLLYGNVQGCVFAKDRPVSLNWMDYTWIERNKERFDLIYDDQTKLSSHSQNTYQTLFATVT